MPIEGIVQPGCVEIDEALRLRKYDGKYDFAFDWYQDEDTVYLVDGVREKYSWETLRNMYEYLNRKGELYFIEAKEGELFRPIGDVTFWQEDMPIVIGEKQYRGKEIGLKVIAALIERGRQLGYRELRVREIYHHNVASRRCFEKAGFRVCAQSETGVSLVITL